MASLQGLMMDRSQIKSLLGDLPYTAELYWYIRQRNQDTTANMSLVRLKKALPNWVSEVQIQRKKGEPRKKVFIFGMARTWIEHTVLLGLTFSGLGYDVTWAYFPYSHWKKTESRFDIRRQDMYIQEQLEVVSPVLKVVSLLNEGKNTSLPADLTEKMSAQAYRDSQYSLLKDEVEKDSPLCRYRLERNILAAKAVLTWLRNNPADVVLTPNGSILEFGVVYQIAKYLNIPVTTFEFGEQHQRIWLAQNRDVMCQETDDLWSVRGQIPLSDLEKQKIRELFESRQGGRLWETFSRAWQGVSAQGGEKVRADLGLDDRPMAFLPTNVLGDSLTLGRQIFSGMTNWLRQTIRYFIDRPEYQLVVRVHPGEQKGWGPSVYDILRETFQELPENVHLIPADAAVNSYDLIEAADLGLVYTTTMGMEMAMSGQTVIVAGQTHYRSKGFTLDPDDWDNYYGYLAKVLTNPDGHRLTQNQVELAWRYAYRFFFEYPQPFPWHLHFWDALKHWPLKRLFSEEGRTKYERTFRYLAGEPIAWDSPAA